MERLWGVGSVILTGEKKIKKTPVPVPPLPPKSHLGWPGIESGLSGYGPATNRLRHGMAVL
jgi:hypothetical protein